VRSLAPCLSLLAVSVGCHTAPPRSGQGAPEPPPPPSACRQLEGGGALQPLFDAASDGEALCLAPGRWLGPATLHKKLALWGPRAAVVAAASHGSVLTVAAAGASVEGLTVDGRGGRFDKLDAAVHVVADDVRVQGVQVVDAVYGVLVEKARRARVIGNHVVGDAATAMGMRGDTIRLWETHDSLVADNLVEDGRDVVVWYSSNNVISNNRVLRGRYGTHFMYSHDNEVRDNALVDGVVGVFVMYSKRVTLRGNLVMNASGASGIAIGLKDSGDVVADGNVLVKNTTGIYIDASPGHVREALTIRGNVIRQCTTAIHFHTTPHNTLISDNDLADNGRQVAADAGTTPTKARFSDNYFDDYAGYDLDDDGHGDLPHRVESASEDLVARTPELAFLRGSPALALVDVGARLLPFWQARVLLVDERPRMSPRPLPPLATVAYSTGRKAPEVRHED
jgi:nitrous oxidase accessory protein